MEPNEEQDVNSESSTEAVEEQQPQEESVTQESQPEETVIEQPEIMPLPVQGEVGEVDEMGVPYKNRFHEVSRKLDKLQNEIPGMVQQAVQQVSQPQHTRDDLEAFLMSEHGQDPVNRKWAQDQLHDLTKKDLMETVRGELRAEREKQQRAIKQQQAFQQAAQLCPDAFVMQNGVPVGLNANSNSAKLIDGVMRSRPDIAQMPDGVAIAAQIARGQLAVQQAQQVAKKAENLEAEKGALQRQQLSTSGDSETAFNAMGEAYEKYRQSGSKKDLLEYMKLKRRQGA